MLKAALSAPPTPATKLYTNVSPTSGSVVLNAPTTALAPAFSATTLEPKAMSVGALPATNSRHNSRPLVALTAEK